MIDCISIADLKQRLVDSQLLSAEELESAASSSQVETNSSQEFAEFLVKSGQLTSYQANCLLGGKAEALSFGDYLILDPIGAGGMGQVYRARHRTSGDQVAIKVLAKQRLQSVTAQKRFEREIAIARELEHSHLAKVLDGNADSESPWYAMEYVEGSDLRQYVDQHGPLDLAVAADYIQQAAQGLQYLHEQGIVHRDIKPANLILTADGKVKLVDLGLARVDPDASDETVEQLMMLTETGAAMGSVDYMAPEQAQDSRSVDHRADLYSLGCTLYFLINCRPPFQRETEIETLLAHSEGKIPTFSRQRHARARAMTRIYQKLLAKRCSQRFQSASDVRAALETARSMPDRRLRRAAMIGVPVLTFLVGWLAFALVKGPTDPPAAFSEDPSTPGDLARYEILLAADGQLMRVNLADRQPRPLVEGGFEGKGAVWSPDGKNLVFRRGSPGDLYLANEDGSQLQRLTQTDSPETDLAWSPDGRQIAYISFVTGNPELWTMQADGSNKQQMTNNTHSDWTPTWSPDGEWIAFVSAVPGANQRLHIIRPDGSELQPLPVGRSGWAPTWHPGGKSLAFHSVVENGSQQIFVASLEGASLRQITHRGATNAKASWSSDGRYLAYAHILNGPGRAWLDGTEGEILVYDTVLKRTETLLKCKIKNSDTSISWKPLGTSPDNLSR